MSLCRHSDAQQKCFPSQEFVANEFSISSKSVRKYLTLLEKANLVRAVKRKGRSGGVWLRNEYYLVDKSEWKPLQEISSYHRNNRKRKKPLQETEVISDRNVVPTNNTHSNNTHNNNTNNSKQSFTDVDEIISKFRSINPNYERLLTSVTQRKAVERLIKTIGNKELTRLLDKLPNILGKTYCPVITTPHELEQKLANLYVFFKKEETLKRHKDNNVLGNQLVAPEGKYAKYGTK